MKRCLEETPDQPSAKRCPRLTSRTNAQKVTPGQRASGNQTGPCPSSGPNQASTRLPFRPPRVEPGPSLAVPRASGGPNAAPNKPEAPCITIPTNGASPAPKALGPNINPRRPPTAPSADGNRPAQQQQQQAYKPSGLRRPPITARFNSPVVSAIPQRAIAGGPSSYPDDFRSTIPPVGASVAPPPTPVEAEGGMQQHETQIGAAVDGLAGESTAAVAAAPEALGGSDQELGPDGSGGSTAADATAGAAGPSVTVRNISQPVPRGSSYSPRPNPCEPPYANTNDELAQGATPAVELAAPSPSSRATGNGQPGDPDRNPEANPHGKVPRSPHTAGRMAEEQPGPATHPPQPPSSTPQPATGGHGSKSSGAPLDQTPAEHYATVLGREPHGTETHLSPSPWPTREVEAEASIDSPSVLPSLNLSVSLEHVSAVAWPSPPRVVAAGHQAVGCGGNTAAAPPAGGDGMPAARNAGLDARGSCTAAAGGQVAGGAASIKRLRTVVLPAQERRPAPEVAPFRQLMAALQVRRLQVDLPTSSAPVKLATLDAARAVQSQLRPMPTTPAAGDGPAPGCSNGLGPLLRSRGAAGGAVGSHASAPGGLVRALSYARRSVLQGLALRRQLEVRRVDMEKTPCDVSTSCSAGADAHEDTRGRIHVRTAPALGKADEADVQGDALCSSGADDVPVDGLLDVDVPGGAQYRYTAGDDAVDCDGEWGHSGLSWQFLADIFA